MIKEIKEPHNSFFYPQLEGKFSTEKMKDKDKKKIKKIMGKQGMTIDKELYS